MTTIDDLEAQLREGLDRGVDRDIVVVYGDQLQELGDPRGELITIDLEIEHAGATPELARRRGEVIESWLGTQRPNGTIRYGFLELDATSADPVEQVRLAFSSKAARFTRSITAVGPPKLLRETIDAIAEAPRPFLSRVTLRMWSEKDTPAMPAAASFTRATPHLKCLEIDARKLFGRFDHPSIQRLRISGFDAIHAELELPALVELDLALHCHLATSRSAPPDTLFTGLGNGMPKLTTLDLSRNEPGYLDPHTLGGDTPIFELLIRLGCRDRLEKLTLPTPRDPAHLASVRAAVRSMPALRELTFARALDTDRKVLTANFARAGLQLNT